MVKIVAAYALLAGSISFLAGAGIVNPYWVQILLLACIVAISAQGLNIIYGYAGLFSLGHAAFYGIGAYTAAYLMKMYGGQSQAAFLGALLAGGGASAAVAWLIGLPTLRLTSDYLGIATLGFGIIMKVVFDNADSFLPELGGARGMTGIAKMTTIPWVILFLLVSLLVVRNTIHSSYGRAILSVREDEIAAETMGIDTFQYKMVGFVTGCAFAGVAGGLYAHLYTFPPPEQFRFFQVDRHSDHHCSRGSGEHERDACRLVWMDLPPGGAAGRSSSRVRGASMGADPRPADRRYAPSAARHFRGS